MAAPPPPGAGGPAPRSALRRYAAGWLLLALAAAVLAGIATRRQPFAELWGDESTYVAMAESLVRDGDLEFGPADAEWARRRSPGGAAVILQRTASGVAYSKPVLYPLAAAPLLALLGEAGLPALNLAALGTALFLAWAALARRFEPGRAWLTVATFAGAGAVLPYALWRMSDALQLALALGGLALACGGLAGGPGARARFLERHGAVAAGGLALGLVTALRPPGGALFAAALAAQLVARRPRRALVLAVAAALGLGLAAGADRLLTGAAVPYKAERTSFDGTTGYPAGEGSGGALARFERDPATHVIAPRPFGDLGRRLYSALYFLVGRHTGVAIYFPAALLFAGIALRRPGPLATPLLAGAAAIALFYVVWLPWNYFGGSTFLGNRYFLIAYAALLVGLPRPPSRRALGAVWALAAVVAVSAALSVARPGAAAARSQSHALAGIFRLLPFESTAHDIDGQRQREWARDLVRFVDPWPQVRRRGFRLRSGRPPAELLVATTWPGSPLLFLAVADSPRATIEVRDLAGRRELALAPAGRRSRAVLEVEPAAAWRRHGLGWRPGRVYRVRALRLALKGENGGDVAATVYYLGNGRVLRQLFSREVISVELPESAGAGSEVVVPVRVRNTGRTIWSSGDDLPVRLGYRLHPAAGGEPLSPPTARLAAAVGPGEVLDAELAVRMPEAPGEYRLVVDLLAPQVDWFADRVGEPLAAGTVWVEPPPG